jgi:tetratricopeptide (TPR) repeat protein/tRNA A-37 threonylcarbamoyl transferase component Bud32
MLTGPAGPEAAGTPESPAPEAVPSSLTPGEALPAQIGRYHIEGEIAHGGVGIVLRAHDSAFQRSLAVKVLLAKHRDKPDVAQRFLEEAQVMGQLQHPGIPPVYDLGELPDGRPYFALKLIKGQTLATLLKERQHPADDLPHLLTIFGQVCQTIAYAHSRGILHRDLKPSNVMVGAFGEVQVMDWGLAKVLGSQRKSATAIQPEEMSTIATVRTAVDDLLTQEGAVMGTLAYMAPEQARGQVDQLDERCDVFGLGAMLCALLTGKPPYVAPTKAEVYRQAKEAALTDAYGRLDACGADAELMQLAKACLTPERAERPRHAGVVAEAVTAYEAQVRERLQQAEVARAQALVKVREERKRRRVTLALAVAVVVLLLGGSVAGWWYQQQAAAQQRRLDEAQQGIEASLTEARKLREAGLQQVDNPSAWGSTLAAARTALEHARTLLSQEPVLAETVLAQQTQQVQALLEADRKDWQLLAVYDQVRLEQSQWDLQRRSFKMAESYPRLQQALAEYGLAIGGLKADKAAARLRQRPSAVQPYVRAVLEECRTWVPKEEVGQRQWLTAVLAVDGDPWLKQFRQALAKGAWAEVEQLAAQAEVGRYHPAVLIGLVRKLPEEARAGQVLLLRRTQQQYPGDFWVNFALGDALYHSLSFSGVDRPARAEELPVMNEAAAFLRVAVGLRPGNPTAHNNLGLTLMIQGDMKAAIACFKQALTLDPQQTSAHTNLGNALKVQGDLEGAIACYKKALILDPKYVPAHGSLGTALHRQGELKGAIASYKKVLDLDPKDAKAHYSLGTVLYEQGDVSGAIACCRKALALDPKLAPAHNNLGLALQAQGDLKGAMACYHKALALDPKYAPAHNNLGHALYNKKDLDGAIACYHKALTLDPKYAKAHFNLGLALEAQGDVQGAIECYTKGLMLDPKDAKAHNNLGVALQKQGDVQGAIECWRKALALDPKDATAHNNLGHAMKTQGDVKGAIDYFRKALALDPKLALAHVGLGNALRAQGDVQGAIDCCKKALALAPKLVQAHNGLGLALAAQKDWKGAMACYTEALRLDPKFAEAHCNLGHALRRQGHFAQALKALQQGHEIGSQRADWRYPSSQWVEECQRLLELEARLTAILAGEDQPKDAAEQLALADLCRRYKNRYAAATRFYAAAFAAGAARTTQRTYNAACAAVLSSAGQGEDANKLEGKEKSRLRQQALAWLQDNLKLYTGKLDDLDAKQRADLQKTLQHWQQDADLASVRDAKALAPLPQAERAAWQQLWAEVDQLRQKAAEPMP